MPLYTTEMDWKQRNPNVTVLQSWTFVMVPETASSVFQCTLINCHTTRTSQTREELMNIRATSPDDLFISFITSSADIVTILVHKVRHCRWATASLVKHRGQEPYCRCWLSYQPFHTLQCILEDMIMNQQNHISSVLRPILMVLMVYLQS